MNRQMPALLKPFVALTYVLLLAPLAIVIAVSFGPSPNFDFPPSGLTLNWYRAFFANARVRARVFPGQPGARPRWRRCSPARWSAPPPRSALVRFRFWGREALGASSWRRS